MRTFWPCLKERGKNGKFRVFGREVSLRIRVETTIFSCSEALCKAYERETSGAVDRTAGREKGPDFPAGALKRG
ncbi:hypothetical protein LptCag_1753 [Leptospirillum ferriphilum]|uniref:Uncharacterized protein n=1 Tax=Leptospirillum ferriphilum TaxID=178606 RepID=A0A094X239_9BACT|nr:hypothetical protein LptCag_1753 [Leptospirillum ferriphilum]OOH73622.1 hypothetical protein BOX24_03865 [Leptospirillum ferriphilum]